MWHILEDTCDFLSWIMEIKDLPEDTLLVSFDAVGLHLHIPHKESIEIMKEFLKQKEVKDISTKRLCDLATIILKNNFFEIDEEVYHQLSGTATGMKFAPTCANLFVPGLEKKIFENTNFKLLLWVQYLDNIFCIWTEGLGRLQEFYQYLNSFRSCYCYAYKKSILYGHVIWMKRICSNEEKLSSWFEDLEHWFCSRDYKKEMVHSEIQKSLLHE